MRVIRQILSAVVRFLEWMLIVSGILMVLLTFLSAAVRKFGAAITWGDEIIRYLFIYTTYLGSVVALYRGKHMMVDVIVGAVKGVWKFLLLCFSDVVIALFSILLVYGGIKILDIASVDSSPILHIPLQFIYVSLPVSGVMMALIALFFLVERIICFARDPKGYSA